MQDDFLTQIDSLADGDGCYKREAYLFVFAALDHTVRALNRAHNPEPSRHVSGQELAWGIAEYAREQYGPMAHAVLTHWGIAETLDFGHIVFALINAELMRKTDDDTVEDFRDVYDLDAVFDPKRILGSLKPLALEQL